MHKSIFRCLNRAARKLCLAGGAVVLTLCGGAGYAATANTNTTTSGPALEEVVITGSRLRRTDTETPSPVEVVTAEQMHQSGLTSIQDVLHNLTANGQGTLSQGFSGAFASGAAGVALRGLNVGATLVLVDGHRTAPYPIGDDGQRSFVDVSNLPFEAIERVEVVKDGASAVYGSDAIAGVVNIILKKSYRGTELNAESGVSSHGDGSQIHLSGIWGAGDLGSDGHNVYVSTEYRKQNKIMLTDRGGIFTQTDFTSSGGIDTTPGVQNISVGALPRSGTGYLIDPATSNIVGFMSGCDSTKFAANQCTYKDTWDQIQPLTENLNIVGRITQNFADHWKLAFDGGYFESKAEQAGGPGRTFLSGYQGVASGPGVTPTLLTPVDPTTIPSTNPTYPAGTGLSSALLRYTFLNIGAEVTKTDAKSYRAVLDLDGKVADWNLDFAAGYTEVSLGLKGIGYINPGNIQVALNSTTAPFLVGQPNSAAVNAFVAPLLTTTDTSKLSFAHAGVDRELMRLSGGPLGLALGIDFSKREQHTVAPADVANGFTPNFSNNFTTGTQNVSSAYAELGVPFVKQFEIDAAVRYDHYNLSGGKASPKLGFKFTPVPQFAVRGTASKGFRAPGPAENGLSGQTFFAGATPDPILCPNPDVTTAAGNFVGQCSVNIPGQQGTDPNLKPETSKAFTLGIIWEPLKDFSTTFDFYSIEVDDQIVSGGPSVTVRGNNLAPLPQYQADGSTRLVTPPAAPIAYTTISFINANTTKTSGFDLGFDYHHRFDSGTFKSRAIWSYTNKYDLTIDGVTYKLAGTHGPFFYSGDTGNPKTRIQWSNTFARDKWEVTGTFNYIGSFNVTDPSSIAFIGAAQDTCINALNNSGGAASIDYLNQLSGGTIPSAVSCNVAHFLTLDLNARIDINNKFSVHASLLNALNEKAPLDWATYGGALGAVPFNPSLHTQGAIGPFFTLGATFKL